MTFDPWRPPAPAPGRKSDPEIKPTDEDVVRALVEIQKASSSTQPSADRPIPLVPERPWLLRGSAAWWLPVMAIMGVAAAVGIGYATRRFATSTGKNAQANSGPARTWRVDPAKQAEAEQILAKVAAGDRAAADQALARSSDWTGKTQRTSRSEQLVSTAINSPDLHAREAAVQAELALDGVPLNETGLGQVKEAIGNPHQRLWALWMMGALANRGVDPVHTTKIIETYLADPQVAVRAGAVDALALVASDETVPMLLDRFRNDPSPVVEERAACDLAESGMYTHDQRMTAAASLVAWLDDASLNAQQHGWILQSLGDISGKQLGMEAGAWRDWYQETR